MKDSIPITCASQPVHQSNLTERNQRGHHSSSGGYTTLDLLIGVAILVVIVTMLVPNTVRALELRRLNTSAETIVSKLSEVRTQAMKLNNRAWLAIEPASRTVQAQGRDAVSGAIVDLGAAETLPSGVTVAVPAATAQVTFNALGALDYSSTASMVTLKTDRSGETVSILVSPVGQITIPE